MTVIAITVFVVAYALIASDRVSKTLVALCGAAIVAALGVVESDDVFFSRETGIDWDVIFLLLGMMVIVSVLRQTGVFEYIAIWAANTANTAGAASLSPVLDRAAVAPISRTASGYERAVREALARENAQARRATRSAS